MTVQSTLAQSGLNMKYKAGVDENGKDVVKNIRYSKVKVDATDEAIFDTADAIQSLLNYPVLEVVRENESILTSTL